MSDRLDVWEDASRPLGARVTPPQPRRTAAPVTPASRVAELTRLLEQERGYLAEACAEIRALRRDYARWHQFQGASFGGIPMAQYPCDLLLWEAILNENQSVRGIVELGTWRGGFSWWLWAQAQARGLQFCTYDATAPDREIPGFVRLDAFAHHRIIGETIRKMEPVVLFCDNGNKPREIKVYPQYLEHLESLIVVHDWGTEVLPSDVPDSLQPIYEEFCDSLGSISRVFKVRSNA